MLLACEIRELEQKELAVSDTVLVARGEREGEKKSNLEGGGCQSREFGENDVQ